MAHRFTHWDGKILVDVTNALHVPAGTLGGSLSSEVVAEAFTGARLVKAFKHLPAAQLGTNPLAPDERQAIFVSGNDADANAMVSALITQLGLAPVDLGRFDQGGVPLHAVDGRPGDFYSQAWFDFGHACGCFHTDR